MPFSLTVTFETAQQLADFLSGPGVAKAAAGSIPAATPGALAGALQDAKASGKPAPAGRASSFTPEQLKAIAQEKANEMIAAGMDSDEVKKIIQATYRAHAAKLIEVPANMRAKIVQAIQAIPLPTEEPAPDAADTDDWEA